MERTHRIDLKLLRYFLAVAEELHFGRAAARLNMSQPPLSTHIKELEQQLGTLLFIRHSRSVALTHAGKILMEEKPCAIMQKVVRLQKSPFIFCFLFICQNTDTLLCSLLKKKQTDGFP